MPPTDGFRRASLDAVQRRVRMVVADGDPHRAGHASAPTGAPPCVLAAGRGPSVGPAPTARRSTESAGARTLLVAKPGASPRQQRGRALEPQRFVFEEPR